MQDLRPYQSEQVEAAFREWEDKQSTLIVSPTGTGKCLAPNTPVLMYDGAIRAAKDVKRGDQLMGPDSRPRNVLSTVAGRDQMYRVIPTKGEPFDVNQPHILSLKMTNGSTNSCGRQFPSGAVINMSVVDYIRQNKTFKHCAKAWRCGVLFPYRHISIDPYFLGLWLGDGASAGLGITNIDPEVISFLEWYAESLNLHVQVTSQVNKTPRYYITHGIPKKTNPIMKALRHYGLINNKHVPLDYKANSRDVRLQILAGLVDSDGSASCGGYDLIFKRKVLAEDVAYLARSLGFAAYVSPCKKTCANNGKTGSYFRISLSGQLSEVPVRVRRKKLEPRRQIKNVLMTGLRVEATGEGDYYGWQLDGDGLFLLGDFTVTHNTTTFTEIVRRFQPRRALIIAHRSELISQASNRLWSNLGINADIEKADQWANEDSYGRASVVVSSVQTQFAGRNGSSRMHRFNPDDFSLLVIDEAHHYVAKSYRKVIDYYRKNPNLKVLGVTATPDRADELALGQIFESVASVYEILDAIHDGWLVPVEQQMVSIHGLDFSRVRTTAGDLNGADLAAVMEAESNLQGIASASLDVIGERKTLAFTVSVKQAERLAEIFNRHKPDMADWIYAGTPPDQRAKILRNFAHGQTQILCNVGILTEGYDAPGVECIVQARPTKSRCLYAQICGRALRPLTGIVDRFETADERKFAIANSVKPAALILDFVGVSGKHKLMTTADILGGKLDDAVLERAVKKAKESKGAVRMDQELDRAARDIHDEIEARKRVEAYKRKHLIGQANFKLRSVDPFDILGVTPARSRGWDGGRKITDKQRGVLLRAGINPDKLSYGQQKQLLIALFARMNKKLATIGQCKTLRKRGVDTTGMTFDQARLKLDEIAAQEGWRK